MAVRNDELVAAALAGNLAEVRRMIEAGADPNSVDANGMGPLLNFHPEVTRYLLGQGANPQLQRNENIYPVLVGVHTSLACMQLMLEAGADANRASAHSGETALHFVAAGSDDDALARLHLLLAHGANPNAVTIPGMSTFHFWRDVRVRGETPLHRAAAWGSPAVIQALLDAGADPSLRDANRDSPLSWASWYWRDKSVIDQLGYEGSGVGPDLPASAGSTEVGSHQANDVDWTGTWITNWGSMRLTSSKDGSVHGNYGESEHALEGRLDPERPGFLTGSWKHAHDQSVGRFAFEWVAPDRFSGAWTYGDGDPSAVAPNWTGHKLPASS